MNQIVKQKSNNPAGDERALLLPEIAKDIASVEEEGFGRVVVEIKSGKIINWWKVASRTRRGFLRKIKDITGSSIA